MDNLMLRRRPLMQTGGKLWLVKNGFFATDNYRTAQAVITESENGLYMEGPSTNMRTLLYFPVPSQYSKAVIECKSCESYKAPAPARPSLFVNNVAPTINIPRFTKDVFLEQFPEYGAFTRELPLDDVSYSYCGVLLAGTSSINGNITIVNFYLI